jgi:6-phosphofructokinase 1
MVKDIHRKGGSFLGTSRYQFDSESIVDALDKKGINQVYVLGGEGTLKCVYYLYQKIRSKKLNIVISAIPKSIENHIPIIDKSFGFESAIEVNNSV